MAKKSLRVNTMYGADGRLRTSYFEGDAAKVARKNVKAFEKELSKYEKEFATYASLDIESSKINDVNSKYIFGKLGIAEQYIDYIPEGDMAESMGDEITAIAGNKNSYKLGIGAKIASKFQPFMEKQAAKHPKLQVLSDRITKAANGGRMPLTADSAAMMRIAFDKKYYNDCRRPGADVDELRRQHDQSIANLTKMALFDGVERSELSAKFSEKLIDQMQIDETLTDIYSGMADGSIRLADDKAVMNANGEVVKVGGKTLYERSKGFVSAEKDAKGRNKPLDAWSFETREPQTIDDILRDYQEKLDKYAASCETEADFKRMLASDSYKNLERNAKVFAETDCPDDAAMFKYEFMRRNLESCRNWALEHDHRSPYANLVVPLSWDERTKGNKFVKGYSTDDYYGIDKQTEVHDEASDAVSGKSDETIAQDMAAECVAASNELSDTDKFNERLNALEAENKELREKLAQMEQGRDENAKNDTIADENKVKTSVVADESVNNDAKSPSHGSDAGETEISSQVASVEPVGGMIENQKPSAGSKVRSAMNIVTNAVPLAAALAREIQEQYHSDSKAILDVNGSESAAIQSTAPLMLEQSSEAVQQAEEENFVTKYYIANNAVTLSYSFEAPVDEDQPELGNETKREFMVVPEHSVMKVVNGCVVSLPYADDDYYAVRESFDVKFDELTSDQLDDMSEITNEQFDTLMPLETQIEDERRMYEDEEQKLAMELEYAEDYPDRSECSAEEINKRMVELKANSFPSYDKYTAELNKVLEGLGSEPKAVKSDLSGRIEKYNLDVDFAKLDYIEIVTYEEEASNIVIYATSDDKPTLVREDGPNACTTYADVSEALNDISNYLDQSATGKEVFVYVQPNEGDKQYIDAAAILNASVEVESKTDKLSLSGRIEKYNLDIDFTKLDYIEIETRSDAYAGGFDDNGHERKDNYDEVSNSFMIYATSDDKPTLVREEPGICTAYSDVSEALSEISDHLDQSVKDADVSVYIKPKDGERLYIDPVAILNASLEAENKAIRSDRIAKINDSIQTNLAALDNSKENESEFV